MSDESLDKAREQFNAGTNVGDVVAQERFKENYEPKHEELSDSEEETINITADLEERNFDGEEEQYQAVQTLKGYASNENDLTEMFWEEFDKFISDFASKIQDETGVDIDQPEFEESTKHEATMVELEPGYQVIFRSGQYEGFTGTVQKVGVGERFEHISVELHQEHPHGDTAYVTPDEVEILTDGSQGTDMDMGNGVDEMPLVGEDSGSTYHDAKKQAKEQDIRGMVDAVIDQMVDDFGINRDDAKNIADSQEGRSIIRNMHKQGREIPEIIDELLRDAPDHVL